MHRVKGYVDLNERAGIKLAFASMSEGEFCYSQFFLNRRRKCAKLRNCLQIKMHSSSIESDIYLSFRRDFEPLLCC